MYRTGAIFLKELKNDLHNQVTKEGCKFGIDEDVTGVWYFWDDGITNIKSVYLYNNVYSYDNNTSIFPELDKEDQASSILIIGDKENGEKEGYYNINDDQGNKRYFINPFDGDILNKIKEINLDKGYIVFFVYDV